jgi:sphingolipid delta-4 desaturase
MFTTTETPEPHAIRRAVILKETPEIRALYGWDRGTIPSMVLAVVGQLTLAWAVQTQLDWNEPFQAGFVAFALAALVGAVLSHLSSMFIHEAAHDNCAPTPAENRFWAFVANTSQVVPGAMTFRKYHLRHHGHLGTLGVDADLPADWDVGRLAPTPVVKGLWVLFLFGFWVARGWERRTPLTRDELLNGVWMLAVNAAILAWIGPIALGWLLLSTLIGHSAHPVAAHFIHEHYVFADGQETFSYYGLLNRVTYNVGYHVEHHDFPKVPGRRLPQVKALASRHYDGLVSHRSWTCVLADFVLSARMGWTRRIVRARRQGGPWGANGWPEALPDPVLLRGARPSARA